MPKKNEAAIRIKFAGAGYKSRRTISTRGWNLKSGGLPARFERGASDPDEKRVGGELGGGNWLRKT